MKILLLSPNPFFQERGTPIAVDLLLRALTELGHSIDVLAYHEGKDLTYDGDVKIHRIKKPPMVRNIRPGLSIKKLICDAYMSSMAERMARENKYDVIHAVEETVFIAKRIKRKLGIPYVFDMDSSMPNQMAERSGILKAILPIARMFEGSAIKHSLAVVPMCDALGELAKKEGAGHVTVLRDISLLDIYTEERQGDLRKEWDLQEPTFMYVGNFEPYQGVDLMIDAFAKYIKGGENGTLVVVGGVPKHIKQAEAKCRSLDIASHVRFVGPQPVSRLGEMFEAADVLVSPRTEGENTPMKIYPYLDSGKPVLATDIESHTQVLSEENTMLAAPTVYAFAGAMKQLGTKPELRARIGAAGKALAQEKYSYKVFRETVADLYGWIEGAVRPVS